MSKIIIIGGGISGLSAGVFARINGFETEIYESNPVLGGECVSWRRGDYTFDGSVQWLLGSKEGTDLNRMWQTLDAFDNGDVVVKDVFLTVEDNGKKIYLYRDIDRLKEHWGSACPEDLKMVKEFCYFAKKAQGFTMPVEKNMTELGIFDYMKMGFKMKAMSGLMMKYGKTNGDEYFWKFKNQSIRNALKTLALPTYPAYSAVTIMGALYSNDGGWPKGGSQGLTSRIENRYKNLGGKVFVNAPVSKIIVESGKAVGIELQNGSRIKGDYIISAVDAHVLMYNLLEGKIHDDVFDDVFANRESKYAFGTCVYVGLGVNADLVEYDSPLVTKLRESIMIGSERIDDIHITIYGSDTGFAPEGKSALKIIVELYDYDYWERLYKDPDAYRVEKEKIAKSVISHVERVYPKVKDKIEVIDVATPVTYNRYCGAYKGAWMGYAANASVKARNHASNIKGVKNLALAGQWLATPGGLPTAALSGKFAVQEVCSKLDIPFKEQPK